MTADDAARLEPLSEYHKPAPTDVERHYWRCRECGEHWPCDAIRLIALERAFDRMYLFRGKGRRYYSA